MLVISTTDHVHLADLGEESFQQVNLITIPLVIPAVYLLDIIKF